MIDPTTCTVVLVRRQWGCGEAWRVVHLVPLSGGTGTSRLLGALCGTSLVGDEVEMVEPGVGTPCTGCLLYQDATAPPPSPSVSTYRAWGWPVHSSADQVLLDLGGECTAVVLPAGLTQAVTAILAGRDRRAPVLVNPGAPQERTLVAGEPYGVALRPGLRRSGGCAWKAGTRSAGDAGNRWRTCWVPSRWATTGWRVCWTASRYRRRAGPISPRSAWSGNAGCTSSATSKAHDQNTDPIAWVGRVY